MRRVRWEGLEELWFLLNWLHACSGNTELENRQLDIDVILESHIPNWAFHIAAMHEKRVDPKRIKKSTIQKILRDIDWEEIGA